MTPNKKRIDEVQISKICAEAKEHWRKNEPFTIEDILKTHLDIDQDILKEQLEMTKLLVEASLRQSIEDVPETLRQKVLTELKNIHKEIYSKSVPEHKEQWSSIKELFGKVQSLRSQVKLAAYSKKWIDEAKEVFGLNKTRISPEIYIMYYLKDKTVQFVFRHSNDGNHAHEFDGGKLSMGTERYLINNANVSISYDNIPTKETKIVIITKDGQEYQL